jgi:hypothetical protein
VIRANGSPDFLDSLHSTVTAEIDRRRVEEQEARERQRDAEYAEEVSRRDRELRARERQADALTIIARELQLQRESQDSSR